MKRRSNGARSAQKKKQKNDARAFEEEASGDEADLMEMNRRMMGDFDDEDISSDDDTLNQTMNNNIEDDPFFDETADEKRVRLAKAYLTELGMDNNKGSSDDGNDNDDDDKGYYDPIHKKLQKDVLKARGRLFRNIAKKSESIGMDSSLVRHKRGHKLSVTDVSVTDDGSAAYSCAKDASIIAWDIETGSKTVYKQTKLQKGPALSISVSSCGNYVACGGKGRVVRIYDTRSQELFHTFRGHTDIVTSVAFQRDSMMVYSCSKDRTVRSWNVEQQGFVETLFGHQSEVQAIDILHRERVVSCSRDKTVRLWKIPEETQLLFRGGPKMGMDCVKMINDEKFVTGSEDGVLSCWSIHKKKSFGWVKDAHAGQSITSVGCVPFSDLVCSGTIICVGVCIEV